MRRVVDLLAVVVILAISLVLIRGFQYAHDPDFCGGCHLIEPFYKSWKEASHSAYGALCTDCHYGSGLAGYLKGEVYAFVMFSKYALGRYDLPTSARLLTNENCLECHPEILDREIAVAGGLIFYHREHVEVKGVECRHCHTAIGHPGAVAQAVVAEPPKISKDICLRCHDGEKAPIVVGSPLTSGKVHPGELAIDTGIWKQEHWKAALAPAKIAGRTVSIERGDCLSCHGEPREVTGCQNCHVPLALDYPAASENCLRCHQETMTKELAAEGLPFYHDKHLLHTSSLCEDCHLRITHQEICVDCHNGQVAPAIFSES